MTKSKIKRKPAVLVIEDDPVFNNLIVKHLKRIDLNAIGVQSWAEAEDALRTQEPDLILLDQQLPDKFGLEVLSEIAAAYPVVMLTAFGSVELAVQAIKSGAVEYLMKPINLDELEVMVKRALANANMARDIDFYKNRTKRQNQSFMVGHSQVFKEMLQLIDAVARSETSVLIQGESGVGKELVARELHERSLRQTGNFVPLDCCAFQENLFESELFGHERGSFTGADRQKKGMVEVAHGGTLFLDEIGEIAPPIQAKLLRVLETGQFRRLGGTKDLSADVRIVAATNKDLAAMAANATFRPDLYYRLSGFVLEVPPLRDRVEDIPLLVEKFLSHHNFSKPVNKIMSPASLERLMSYAWPGNIRELRNVVERSIILSGEDAEIAPAYLGLPQSNNAGGDPGLEPIDGRPTLEEMRRRYVEQVLSEQHGHRQATAQILGISERNLYRLLKQYAIDET